MQHCLLIVQTFYQIKIFAVKPVILFCTLGYRMVLLNKPDLNI
jgi:hypothetical protein